jgi:hypothetical protein
MHPFLWRVTSNVRLHREGQGAAAQDARAPAPEGGCYNHKRGRWEWGNDHGH